MRLTCSPQSILSLQSYTGRPAPPAAPAPRDLTDPGSDPDSEDEFLAQVKLMSMGQKLVSLRHNALLQLHRTKGL